MIQEANELMTQIVRSLDRHKALDIKALCVHEVTPITDYFVIAEGTGSTQVRALSDYVEEELKALSVTPLRKEGYPSSSWVLMDYGSVILHAFQRETRQYYDLERLWKDGTSVDLSGILNSEEI